MKKLAFLIGIGMMATLAKAQQIPLYSNYFFTPYIYNPAMSGSSGVTEATILHRRQWSGIQGSPETSAIGINGAMDGNAVGWSIYGFSDKTDILSRVGAYGNYAYSVRLSDDITLMGGLGAGYVNQSIDQNGVRAQNAGDIYTVVAPNRGTFDINVGLGLKVQEFTLGFAAPQLLSQNVIYARNPSDINYNLIRHYVATLQYDFAFAGDKQVLSPIIMVRAAEGVPFQVDAGLLYRMTEYGYVGAMFRSDYGVTANIGVNLTEQLTLGYAYDFSTNTYGSNFGTSHEFMLSYRFGSNKENDRMKNEIKRLKQMQRRQKDEVEETVDEKLQEFKDSYKGEMRKALEDEKKKMQKELEDLRQQAAQNSSNTNNAGQQATNNNQGRQLPPRPFDDRNQNQQNTGQQNNTGGQTSYPEANRASNVTPGSAGYYVTAGVFGQQANANRLMTRLRSQGLDAQIFQDQNNSFYYVYLLKFASYQEADQAKSSGINGAYQGDLWIKIVK